MELTMETDDLGIARRLRRIKSREGRTRSFGTKLTMQEEQELIRAAAAEGQSASEWSREVLLREARKTKDDALFTEVVAIRMLLNMALKPLALDNQITSEIFADILTAVRTGKQKAAQDIRQAYTAAEQKEQ